MHVMCVCVCCVSSGSVIANRNCETPTACPGVFASVGGSISLTVFCAQMLTAALFLLIAHTRLHMSAATDARAVRAGGVWCAHCETRK
jgi:hypothetical protein